MSYCAGSLVKLSLSDSYHKEERPWYGIAGDPLGGYRRQYLAKPTGPDPATFNLQLNMSVA